MKFCQSIEYNKNSFFTKTLQKMRHQDQFQTSVCFFKKGLYEVKGSCLQLISVSFDSPQPFFRVTIMALQCITNFSRTL